MSKVTNNENMRRYVHMKLSNQGGGNTPSGNITIDDVIKFIHDEFEKNSSDEFPYTTWDEIPEYGDIDSGFCKTDDIYIFLRASAVVLNLGTYVIGYKTSAINQ